MPNALMKAGSAVTLIILLFIGFTGPAHTAVTRGESSDATLRHTGLHTTSDARELSKPDNAALAGPTVPTPAGIGAPISPHFESLQLLLLGSILLSVSTGLRLLRSRKSR